VGISKFENFQTQIPNIASQADAAETVPWMTTQLKIIMLSPLTISIVLFSIPCCTSFAAGTIISHLSDRPCIMRCDVKIWGKQTLQQSEVSCVSFSNGQGTLSNHSQSKPGQYCYPQVLLTSISILATLLNNRRGDG